MKISVVEPKQTDTTNIIRDVLYGCWCGGKRIGGASIPPFEQLTIATLLQSEGHEVIFIDAQAEQLDLDSVKDRVADSGLLIMSTSVMTVLADSEYARALKEVMPNGYVTFYGSHATFKPEETLSLGIDFAIRREPEMILVELAEALENGDLETARNVNGVVCKSQGDNSFIRNKRHPFMSDLDSVPAIDLKFLPKNVEYFNPIVRNLPYIAISTSHGCPARCSYCTAPFFHGTKTRFQSAQKVLSDIQSYLNNGMREIYFRDETFTANRERIMAICEGIQKKGLEFSWICNARVDTIDKEMLVAMKKSGCHLIKFGTESGNQAVLDTVKKDTTLEQARDAFKWCKEVGIDTHAHFMVGMPGDNMDSMNDTLNFSLEINPTTVTYGICTPYPGTPLFNSVVKVDENIEDGAANAAMDRLHIEGVFNHLYADVEGIDLSKVVNKFYRKFYLRPTYLLKMLFKIRNKNMLRNVFVGGLNVISFSLGNK